MKLFMLDTDISSYIIRRRPKSLARHFERHADEICVSVITAAELRFGVEKSKSAKLADLVESFLERLSILDWTHSVTPHYARIRAALERLGKPMGNADLMIAAHAVSQRATVVTSNVRHFAGVPGLKVEDWTE
ncbi:MAG: PIN domain-containing protein [Steroidobacteraceae bacterium]